MEWSLPNNDGLNVLPLDFCFSVSTSSRDLYHVFIDFKKAFRALIDEGNLTSLLSSSDLLATLIVDQVLLVYYQLMPTF